MTNRFFIGVHRGGSTMLTCMVARYLDDIGVPYNNPEGDAFAHPSGIHMAESLYLDYKAQGVNTFIGFCGLPDYVYSDIRDPTSKLIFLVRNPLDVLVSRYFQFYRFSLGGHVKSASSEYNDSMLEMERRHLHLTINQVVINDAPNVLSQYQSIVEFIGKAPSQAMVLQYEGVLFNKPQALLSMMRFVGFPCDEKKAILAGTSVDVKADPGMNRLGSHVRHVLPGDHLNHLDSATIANLSALLRNVVRPLGYYL